MVKENKNKQQNIFKGYNMLLYFAGSMIMFEPSEECLSDFWTRGIVKNLPVSSRNPRFIKAASQLRESCIDKQTCFQTVKEDYNRLFSRNADSLVPPYESVYRNNNHLSFVEPPKEVSDFYRSYGWRLNFVETIPDDHLGIELFFLILLIEKYLELDDEHCKSEMKDEIKRYIVQHILSWIPYWNKDIQEYAHTLCYKGIGTLIYACIEDMYSMFSQSAGSVK